MAESLPHHYCIRRLDAVYHAAEIHPDNLVPIPDPVMTDISADADPRVVENIIKPSRAFDGFPDHLFHGRVIANVHFDRHCLAAPRADPRRNLFRQFDLEIGQDRFAAALCQSLCKGGS
jgi:hypothetical protein